PRLGIAYQANSKTVVRLGYGRSFDIGVFGTIFGHSITQNLPVLGSQDYSAGGAGAQDINTAFFLQNGPQSFNPSTALTVNNCNAITDPTGIQPDGSYIPDKTQCLGANGRSLLPNGVFARIRPFNNRLPTVDAWNVSVQRQITSTLSATVAYVGNKGTHTLIGDNPAYGLNNRTVQGYNPNCKTLDPLDPTKPSAACIALNALPYQLRTPFYLKYGWLQGVDYFGNDADNHYNSLQATVEKRFSGGLSLQSSYTFQHAMYYSNNGYFNIDKSVGYGPNSNYRNHVFILTELYQLPFGKGKRWGSDSSRVVDAVLGGWQITTSWNISSGLPFTPSLANCSASIDNGPCRPDRVGSITSGTRSGDPRAGGYWFGTTGGVPLNTLGATANGWGQTATIDTFGNVQTNSYRGPKFFNVDAGLFKDFILTERFKAQFQFQTFNLFNHANLDLPNTTVDASNGGAITNIAYGSQMRRLQFGLKLAF
ncbi:MAG TPA: hypothetical protein VII25_11415, partial [Candidatus Acidoferrum sp.]